MTEKEENNQMLRFYLTSLIFLLSANLFSDEPKPAISDSQIELKTKIENIISPKKLKDLKAGIFVSSLQTGEILYEQNADELLVPASVNKVFTAYSALKKLKPNFTFKTQVFITGTMISCDLELKKYWVTSW